MKYGIFTITLLLLLVGCVQNGEQAAPKKSVQKSNPIQEKNLTKPIVRKKLPPPPKKEIKLKEVDDTNFNPEYMYPEDKNAKAEVTKAPETPVVNASADTMGKEECIAMISQDKFDKYTAMFGSEAASIKRCKMLKAMR
ncbi:hypothetical protein [Sulfurovum sp.]|uniref:hypothetical protein n=1 Tax=Sulfurovum sp. TaxID=1969726 RepID=UPI002867E0C0|nr:hypothetical protein [Sulfurovum sp.]